jgi:phosphomannomutase
MNIKFQSKMNELGLSVNDLSASLQKKVQEFYETYSSYQDSLKDLEEYDEEDKDEIQKEVDEVGMLLNQQDEELTRNIERFNRNKEVYASNAQKMAEGRANKKLAKQNNGAISNAVPPIVHEAGVQIPQNSNNITNPVVNNDPNNSNNPAPQQKVEENSSNWGWWALAGIVAVVTLGQVVLKDK